MIHFEESHLVINKEVPAKAFTAQHFFVITGLDIRGIILWCDQNVKDYVVGSGIHLLHKYGIHIQFSFPTEYWRPLFSASPEWFLGLATNEDALRFKLIAGQFE